MITSVANKVALFTKNNTLLLADNSFILEFSKLCAVWYELLKKPGSETQLN